LAQHHGLATRMLDWTRNPLVAAFFAVWEEGGTDAALYGYMCSDMHCGDYAGDPFEPPEEENVYAWRPDAISARISRQQGVFTVHEPPTTPLSRLADDKLMCVRIDKGYRAKLREELAYYGITRASLFPDLDGLAEHHNWGIRLGSYVPTNL
jgi:hypothetical protein